MRIAVTGNSLKLCRVTGKTESCVHSGFYRDADNTAGTAEQVFSSAFSNMGNGLATFVTTGKLNFKSFTSSVLSDMAKILAQATMNR
ncbi:hypothetical protein AOY53_12900 [Escherichia coli]|nr:hypothetical protein AOY53_12900 [Escherichia coli]